MARPRRRPSRPSQLAQGDTGPDTAAQRAGAVVLELQEDNGAVFRRKRRDHALEIIQRRGDISARQMAAGLVLYAAAADTMRSPESAFSRVYVDASPQPDNVAIMQAERVGRLAAITQHIPRGCWPIVEAVCVRSVVPARGFDDCARLQVALDIVGNHLGL